MVIATYTEEELYTMENWDLDMGRIQPYIDLPTEEDYESTHFPIEGVEEGDLPF